MVAKLKLKGIDGRAPPEMEPFSVYEFLIQHLQKTSVSCCFRRVTSFKDFFLVGLNGVKKSDFCFAGLKTTFFKKTGIHNVKVGLIHCEKYKYFFLQISQKVLICGA